MNYSQHITVLRTAAFDNWLRALGDRNALGRILVRIDRLAAGNPGDIRAIRHGLYEMRIDYGAGYRLYFHYRGSDVVLLLAGGNKSTQRRDIRRALELMEER